MSPNEKRAAPARPDQPWPPDQPPEHTLLMSHQPHACGSAHPLFGSAAVVLTTDIAQPPHDQAIEHLAWMAQALVVATLPTA